MVDPPRPASEAYDAADPEAVRRAEAAAQLREEQRRQVALAILATAQGREWLWQVMKDARFLETRIAVTASQYEQGFFDGQREVGLGLMRVLARANPEDFARLLRENDG